MCHLWPYRSVERYTDFAVRSEDRRPAYPVLVLGYDHNPIARESYYIQVLRQLWRPEGEDRYDDASVVMQQQFTVCVAVPDVVGLGADVVSKTTQMPVFGHGRCLSRIIVGYLTSGKVNVPDHDECTHPMLTIALLADTPPDAMLRQWCPRRIPRRARGDGGALSSYPARRSFRAGCPAAMDRPRFGGTVLRKARRSGSKPMDDLRRETCAVLWCVPESFDCSTTPTNPPL